jgi:hypothetical protein
MDRSDLGKDAHKIAHRDAWCGWQIKPAGNYPFASDQTDGGTAEELGYPTRIFNDICFMRYVE